MKGMIKFYNKDKGFGFVVGEDNQEYYFNHQAIAYGELPDAGRYCEFESKENTNNDKRPEIKTLKVVQQSSVQESPILSNTQQPTITPNPTPRKYPRNYSRRQQVEVVYQPKSALDLLIEAHIGIYLIFLGFAIVFGLIVGVIDFFKNPIAFITDPIKLILAIFTLFVIGVFVFLWKKKSA